MKKLLALTLLFNLILAATPVLSETACAQVNPWPWARQLPFPWDNIEGTWTESSSLFTYSFQKVENSWGERHIIIKQVNPESGAKIMEGIGNENDEGIVVAVMTDGQNNQYLLTIRLLQNVFCWDERKVTGVTIESFDSELIHHFEIHKIAETPLTPNNIKDYKSLLTESEKPVPICWSFGSLKN